MKCKPSPSSLPSSSSSSATFPAYSTSSTTLHPVSTLRKFSDGTSRHLIRSPSSCLPFHPIPSHPVHDAMKSYICEPNHPPPTCLAPSLIPSICIPLFAVFSISKGTLVRIVRPHSSRVVDMKCSRYCTHHWHRYWIPIRVRWVRRHEGVAHVEGIRCRSGRMVRRQHRAQCRLAAFVCN